MYLVIKPTNKNVHGFTYVGGNKLVIDKSLKYFNTENSPKNIQTSLLRIISIKKHIQDRSHKLKKSNGSKHYISFLFEERSVSNDDQFDDKVVDF